MSYGISAKAQRFHGLLDTEIAYTVDRVRVTKGNRHIITQEREVTYRFTLHQHPYVRQLTQRLLSKGTSGLQAADTQYQTRVRLPQATNAVATGGRSVSLAAGETLFLTDGTAVTYAGEEIRFAGHQALKLPGGLPLVLAPDEVVTLPNTTTVRRGDGSTVTFSSDVAATLIDGAPSPVLFSDFFAETYGPNSTLVPNTKASPHPVEDLDFTSSGAYSVYNWELFYHVPLTIALHLSKNQRFAEAQHWFHYLFDPTDDSDGPTPERFWKVRPFQSTDVRKIEDVLVNLATGADPALRNETIRSIEAWRDMPFRPHVIARYRQQAYMYKTVMAYLDNLIAWGDSLFRQDTGEAIDEAMMLYVLAANILGPRPQAVPRKGTVRPRTYANLRQDLRLFGTVLREVEADLPFDLMPLPTAEGGENDRLATLRGLGKALYFCVPRNDKLLSYWETVADRLFKIRNSLNIQGVFRQLALFEPPIDPALLARAAAAGLDVGAVVNGLNQPLPLVRFTFLIQKAAEIVQEVKSLGNNLLSAMEKEDNEALALLRARHERAVMRMVEHVKYGQLQEAIKAKEGLLESLALAVQRYTHYEGQLGRAAEEINQSIPDLSDLDKDNLAKMRFAMQEPEVATRTVTVDISQDLGGAGGKIVSSHEREEVAKLQEARDLNDQAATKDKIAAGLSLLPELGVDFKFWGIGGHLSFGGSALSRGMSFWASFARTDAERRTYESGNASKIGSYTRREQEWAFQSNLAAGEIAQIFKQLRAAQLREAVAEHELNNHRQQMKHAEELEHFLNEEGNEKTGKLSNRALYTWMRREVKGLYSQCFQFAFDVARKAERALRHELGNSDLSYLQAGYLAGKEGLLAGEKLYLDVKRMELAYHELNGREYELTNHVSLLQVDPLALIQLRTTGRCTVRLPESLFDLDGPGHYFRRIKTVAVSLPCISGPYTGVNCQLRLLKSSVRKTPVLRDGVYARDGAEDDRFSDYFGSLQAIVTSSGQNDPGLFEANLRDERYLPFEGSGAVSEWQLQLPADPSRGDPCQFDYDTISDVVLHVRYTAREGGELLRGGSLAALKTEIEEATAAGSVRLFSVRHEFPSAWARFQRQAPSENQRHELALDFHAEHYPFWGQERLGSVKRMDLLARSARDQTPASLDVFDGIDDQPESAKKDTLSQDAALSPLLIGRLHEIALPAKPTGRFSLYFGDRDLKDVWLSVTWGA